MRKSKQNVKIVKVFGKRNPTAESIEEFEARLKRFAAVTTVVAERQARIKEPVVRGPVLAGRHYVRASGT